MLDRRAFVVRGAGALIAAGLARPTGAAAPGARPRSLYRISLAQWSLHRHLRSGKLDTLGFPALAAEEFGIDAVEYVNTFFKGRARDGAYLRELASRARDVGVSSLLIMVDGEGRLGDPDPDARARAVADHTRWLEAASRLGCHSIRVNAISEGSAGEQRDLAADGLRRLAEIADSMSINVIVENHGGLSSDGSWLAGVMRHVDHPRCGTLPDFGNFDLGGGRRYDAYRGVAELMPWARAVSAKSYDFGADGRETSIDYLRMMRIVLGAGYRGHVGIEYEGDGMSEFDGIHATRSLLLRVHEILVDEGAYSDPGR